MSAGASLFATARQRRYQCCVIAAVVHGNAATYASGVLARCLNHELQAVRGCCSVRRQPETIAPPRPIKQSVSARHTGNMLLNRVMLQKDVASAPPCWHMALYAVKRGRAPQQTRRGIASLVITAGAAHTCSPLTTGRSTVIRQRCYYYQEGHAADVAPHEACCCCHAAAPAGAAPEIRRYSAITSRAAAQNAFVSAPPSLFTAKAIACRHATTATHRYQQPAPCSPQRQRRR